MPPTEDTPQVPPHRTRGGVFITRGASVAVPAGGLRINFGADGSLDASLTLHVGLHLFLVWGEIALAHLIQAKSIHVEVLSAWQGTDDEALGTALISEFKASMQAVMSAAISIDAFYAEIRNHIQLPDSLVETWRNGRTARHKQVGEVMRRAFNIKPRQAVGVRNAIKEIYRFRDWAVHPPAGARAPVRHPELHLNTEWRFVAFSYSNARELVRAAISMITQATDKEDLPPGSLQDLCGGVRKLFTPVVSKWEEAFGPLRPSPTSNGAA